MPMDLLLGGLILAGIIVFFTYVLHSNDDGDPSIPYASYGSYPIIGHLVGFTRDRTKLFSECSQRYGSCFRIKVLNKRFTMLSSYTDWATIVRNQSLKLMTDELAIRMFGLSPAILNQPEFDADHHRLYVQHLKNRDGLRPMVVQFVRRIRELMKNDKMELEKKGSSTDWVSSGLLKFSHHMLYQPSTLALVGEIELASIEKDFILFDQKFHYFGLPLPRWIQSYFLQREVQARTHLAEMWLKNPNPPKASEFHLDRLAICNNHSQWLSDQDRGLFLTGFLWASLGNTIPAVFWSLFYILRDTKALETIRQELDTHLPIVSLDSNVDDSSTEDWTPEQLDACIYLESAINETLRLVGTIFMTRTCLRQTEINLEDGRTITVKPNETLAWFSGTSHHDEKIFPQADKFIFDRFLNKKVDNFPGYMPFGGGKSICPGRFFAKYEIKTCVALLLRYMEYNLDNTTAVPSQLEARIGFGIAPPRQDVPILYRYKT